MDITEDKKEIILKITSIFENSTPNLQYGYIEALGDGRGYTFGYCGFTTGTGDGIEVIKQLPSDAFVKYLPRLQELANEESGDISGLEGFEEAWKQIGDKPEGIKAQQKIGDQLYWQPAVEYADKLGWKTPLALACLYDTIIQHGDGDDPDSIKSIINRVILNLDEHRLVSDFLDQRVSVLRHATDPETREEWKYSVPRVIALAGLVSQGNWQLNPPIKIESSDFNYTIT